MVIRLKEIEHLYIKRIISVFPLEMWKYYFAKIFGGGAFLKSQDMSSSKMMPIG